jgi:hypothetical protein
MLLETGAASELELPGYTQEELTLGYMEDEMGPATEELTT